jgi:hypothetical protein
MRRAAPKAGTSVKDCALENFVDHRELGALAQLRPAAAGLERSAAHPANEVGPSKNVGAQHHPCQIVVEPAPEMEARRAETFELKHIKVRSDGLGSRQLGRAGAGRFILGSRNSNTWGDY